MLNPEIKAKALAWIRRPKFIPLQGSLMKAVLSENIDGARPTPDCMCGLGVLLHMLDPEGWYLAHPPGTTHIAYWQHKGLKEEHNFVLSQESRIALNLNHVPWTDFDNSTRDAKGFDDPANHKTRFIAVMESL